MVTLNGLEGRKATIKVTGSMEDIDGSLQVQAMASEFDFAGPH